MAAVAVVCTAARAGETDVFVSGTQGYHTFRIPSAIVTKKGTVLAFAEGRKGGRGDSGNIDMCLRRSADGGKTWDKMRVIWDDRRNVCGNPCPKVLYAGSAAYSCLTVLPDGTIGCLYEKDGYRKITFARFTLDWLTAGKDSLKSKPLR